MVCLETSDDKSERTQKNIDRARAQSHYLLRRSIAELRILQTERTTRLQLKVQGDLPGVTSTKQLLSTLKMDAAQDTKAPGSVASFCKPGKPRVGQAIPPAVAATAKRSGLLRRLRFVNPPRPPMSPKNRWPGLIPTAPPKDRQPLVSKNTPRNAPCPCGSGRKFKRCHGNSAAAEQNKAA